MITSRAVVAGGGRRKGGGEEDRSIERDRHTERRDPTQPIEAGHSPFRTPLTAKPRAPGSPCGLHGILCPSSGDFDNEELNLVGAYS